MQSAESVALGTRGETPKGGPAAAMQSAAQRNEQMGVVGDDQAAIDTTVEHGVTVSETPIPCGRVVTEFVAGQANQPTNIVFSCPTNILRDTCYLEVVGQFVEELPTKITIGEALEAAALAEGGRPVERGDAAVIKAAEAAATGLDAAKFPVGLAAQARSAAAANLSAARDEDKTNIGDILSNATAKMVADKEVESEDTARVAGAETRNNKTGATAMPGGVSASMAAAARLNRGNAP
uniref:SMP domain-containing protein n=1 Tax=Leersia perrieri TaxID=77586 RepID=A0A0D9VPT0_9ORYZ